MSIRTVLPAAPSTLNRNQLRKLSVVISISKCVDETLLIFSGVEHSKPVTILIVSCSVLIADSTRTRSSSAGGGISRWTFFSVARAGKVGLPDGSESLTSGVEGFVVGVFMNVAIAS